MNIWSKNRIDIFRIFYFLMIALVLIFMSMRSRFSFNTVERAVYSTLAYVPCALLGIVSLFKPDLPIEAFMSVGEEVKPKDYWLQRIVGILWILFFVILVMNAWKYVT